MGGFFLSQRHINVSYSLLGTFHGDQGAPVLFGRFKQSFMEKVAAASAVVLILWSQPGFASEHFTNKEKLKEETELHLGLSVRGFEQLSKALSLGASGQRRVDFYFDVHDGEKFLMRRTLSPAKLRIQKRENTLLLQKSWVKSQSVMTSMGFDWLNTTRISANCKNTDDGDVSYRLKYSEEVLRNAARNSQISPSDKNYLQDLWRPVVWPKLSIFDAYTAHLPRALLPAAVVLKERWLVKLKSPEGENVELQIGRDTDLLGNGQPQSFELEAELHSDSAAESTNVAQFISTWIAAQGIPPEQTSARSVHDFFDRLEKLYP